MRFGPSSLRFSSILAKGLRRPKLRSDIRISEQTVAGEKSCVVKIPETNSYNRYGAIEFELLTLCDGTRTPAEVTEELNHRHPSEPLAQSEVLDFLDSVDAEMWERTIGEKNLAVLQRIRDERRGRVDQSKILYISFKAWDPNNFLAKIDPYLSWMFTTQFVVASSLLFVICIYLIVGDWSRIAADTQALYTFQNKTAYDIWAFWILLLAIGCIHECGHGLTCKHFGGDVHQMGFLLIYFTPAFFTDTTDIVLFQRGAHRQWVIFAGMWIELTICAVASVIWHFTLAGSFVNDLAYKAMLLSGIQGALLNVNPLIKADGYYALAQFLEIDNLREDSFAFLRAAVRKYLLGEPIDLPNANRRLRRIYTVFGLSAIVYSTLLILLVLLWAKNVTVEKFGAWGYLLTLAIVYLFARKGLRKAAPAIRAWWREKKEAYMHWRFTRPQQIGALALGVLLLVPPFPSTITSDFTLEPGTDMHVRAMVPGQIQHVFVNQGDSVRAGQLLAILANPALTTSEAVTAQELADATARLRSAQQNPDAVNPAATIRERERLAKQLAITHHNAAQLELRAQHEGIVTTPVVAQKVGQFLYAGDEFCRIVDRRQMKARILVSDGQLTDVHANQAVRMKLTPFPYRTYSGRIERIQPAAAADQPVSQPARLERLGQDLTNYFAVEVEFQNPDGSLLEGMTGTAKIYTGRASIAWQWSRDVSRWVRSQVW
ncbi:MAG: efflux RND transporter periplasmic adaptor subunit [Candidatus Acidiferrales bacterium]